MKNRGQHAPSDEEIREAVPPRAEGKELRIGAFVLVGVLSAFVALYLLTDPSTFRGRYTVTTTVEDAGGLRAGDPVQMRGVNIGRVQRFEMVDDAVRVSLEIEGEWRMPSDSRVRLVSLGLLGGRIVEVLPGTSRDPLEPRGHLPGEMVEGLSEAAGSLGGQAGTVLERIQELLGEPTVESLRASAVELRVLMGTLSELAAAQSEELGRLTSTLNRSASGLEEVTASGPQVARAIARADSTMALLNGTSAALNSAVSSLQAFLEGVERGQGTLGQLATNDSVYQNLNLALESVHLLATDLREHPERYLKLAIF